MRLTAILTMLLFLGCTAGDAQPARPVVIELFTSQGCSSCPPADRLLSKLQHEGNVIPLAYHVDYWNYIGWTDPFSSPRWSDRQRTYAQKIKGSQVYTPQAVINGKVQLVGSSESAIRAELGRQGAKPAQGAVFIDNIERAGDQLTVTVRAQNAGRDRLVITLFENGLVTAVSRGENEGRNLTNDGIVRWQGIANGTAVTIPLDPKWKQLGVAAFLQDPGSLEIHAATARNL